MRQEAYIFIGPPGSGKGSISKLCTTQFGWLQLSTGDLCRKHISEETPIGKEIDFIFKSGKLVSDELVTSMVDCWLADSVENAEALILDGYPRNIMQARSLLELVKTKYPSLKIKVIRFIVSDKVAIDRVCSRYICQNYTCQAVYSGNIQSGLSPKKALECDHCAGQLGRRTDDEYETIKRRLHTYREFEHEMLSYLSGHELIEVHIEVHVERPLEEVFEFFKVSVQGA